MPTHPRIAVLGSRGTFTAHAVSTLCARGVPPVALMSDADPAPRTRAEIRGGRPASSTSSAPSSARGSPGSGEIRGDHPALSTHSPGPRARGEIPVEVRSPAARVAVVHGVALIRGSDPNHPEVVAALERFEPDLLLLACLPRIAGRATRRAARLGALNLHPSALPRFRGPDPVFWQLRAGIDRAGVTLHVATGVLDAGPVVVQRWIGVEPGTSAGALTAALVRSGVHALVEALPGIERRIREAVPQDESEATRQPRPRAGDFRIDTSWTAERAYRFIEGVRAPATTFTVLGDGGEIEVERAIGFDMRPWPGPAVERSGGTVTIRFTPGKLLAVPARSSRD